MEVDFTGIIPVATLDAEITTLENAGTIGTLTAAAVRAALQVTSALEGANGYQVKIDVSLTPVHI